MNASEALKIIISCLGNEDVALFTTGFISRRAFEIDREKNFYMVGSMGLLSALGLGIALNKPEVKVVIVEGDGSALMSLGNLALIGFLKPRNFYHIVLDNESYESTGGQPTITGGLDLSQIASVTGYEYVVKIEKHDELMHEVKDFLSREGPCFMLVKVEPSEEVSPRVSLSPEELKERLRSALAKL